MQNITDRMKKALDSLAKELATVRTGQATAALLDRINIDYYGSPTPVAQVASIAIPEARQLTITPWEKALLGGIEKAILTSDLGLTPTNDGEMIRLSLPELNEDRRREFVKKTSQMGEKSKVAIRNIRRDFNDVVKKEVKNKELSEDESRGVQERNQTITDDYIAQVDVLCAKKEKDILTI
ncbi:MAG: ribosome recycling factor [Mariprofundaceae bacterium]|nr:ribosome recycling factor [Mariprofundaceae bacterium]